MVVAGGTTIAVKVADGASVWVAVGGAVVAEGGGDVDVSVGVGGNSVNVAVGGTAVGGTDVGGTAVGGTAVGGTAVGGTAVGGTDVGMMTTVGGADVITIGVEVGGSGIDVLVGMTGVQVRVKTKVGNSLIWVGVGRSGDRDGSPSVGNGVMDGNSVVEGAAVTVVASTLPGVVTGLRWRDGATPNRTNPTQ